VAELSTPLGQVIGKTSASPLAKHRGLHTVGDLLDFVPRRYNEPGKLTDLSGLVEGDDVTVVARVDRATTRPMRQRRGRMLNAIITDGAHELDRPSSAPMAMREGWLPACWASSRESWGDTSRLGS